MPTRSCSLLWAVFWRTSCSLPWLKKDLCRTHWGQSVRGTKPQQGGQLGGLLQECTADLHGNIIVDAPKADFLAQQNLKQSTDIHIIIVCHFQCKISRLLLTHIQHTWVHNPSKQPWPPHGDIADYNIWNKINSPLAFVTLSTCDTFLTSWLILKKIRIEKERQVLWILLHICHFYQ